MLKLIMFDYDGVLINSTMVGFCRHQRIARELNLKVPTFKIIRKYWGEHFENEYLPHLARDLNWPEGVIELFVQKSKELYQSKPHIKPFEGVIELLNELKNRFYLVILTQRDKKSLTLSSKNISIDLEIFSIVMTPENCQYPKSDPRVFNPIFEQLKVEVENSVFIGDTIKSDFLAARNHIPPIKFVGITSGMITKKGFKDADLDKKFILKSVVDLPKILHLL